MSRVSSQLLAPLSIRSLSAAHNREYGAVLLRFRRAVHREFVAEVERMCHGFVQGPLAAQAEPLLIALRDYTTWLGWCVWCSSHLAPPLGLIGAEDIKRVAASLLVYCGPRLIDDAVDDHRTYKGRQATLLSQIASAFPDVPIGSVRCQTALIGSWMILYGLQRLERHGGSGAAMRTMRVCERIAPGAVLETLHAAPFSWDQYAQIVTLKAVYYDEILYRNLLDPLKQPLKSRMLELAARLSRIAQYLNDFRDAADDRHLGQKNLLEWFPLENDFWSHCQSETEKFVAGLDDLPPDVANAFAAALVETVDAAARLNALPEAERVPAAEVA
jgi:hypothetical protein